MVLALIALVAAFFLSRFLIERYTGDTSLATFVTGCVFGALSVGFVFHPYQLPASSADPGSRAPAVVANVVDVSAACSKISDTPRAGGIGFVDRFADQKTPDRAIASNETIPGNVPYVLLGWAASDDGMQAAHAVCLVVDGKVDVHERALYGSARPDVAASRNSSDLAASGYQITVAAGGIPKGAHRIAVAIVSADGSAAYAHNVFDVTVR